MTQVFPIVLVYIFKILNDALFPIVMFSLLVCYANLCTFDTGIYK